MANTSTTELRQDSLFKSIKLVTLSWEIIKKHFDLYQEEIATAYFSINPTGKELFNKPKLGEILTDETTKKKLNKHSSTIMHFMEAIVDFVNGNEESKPIFFVLGKHHKILNVNEKMFLEMKDAICRVIRYHLESENSKAWETVLQYIFVNYVFEGMHMIETF